MSLDPVRVRERFPALRFHAGGRLALFADGPGGTQVPAAVIDAMTQHLRAGTANLGGAFPTSRAADQVVEGARGAVADLVGADPDEIVFGQNMTSLTFALSRALGRTWEPGDEVVVTRLDHDADIWPWVRAARERRVTVRWWDVTFPDCRLDPDELADLLGPRTRLVAVTAASNVVGTLVEVERVAELAHEVGARVFVDAVHIAPHGPIDVRRWGCDFLAASAYKFFGPHLGILYGRRELLETLEADRVRAAPEDPPGKWETGTQNLEGLAGLRATVDYLISLGGEDREGRRSRLVGAMEEIRRYERRLSEGFLEGLSGIPGARCYGVVEDAGGRTPTFGLQIEGIRPRRAAEALGRRGIFVWDGHHYAVTLMERLGLLEEGGLLRVGFVHYNTPEEVDRVLGELGALRR